jgi:hypothetical protein
MLGPDELGPNSERADLVMATAIDVVARRVPSGAVGWFPADPHGRPAAGSILRVSGLPMPVPVEVARREYVCRYHAENPFAPSRLLDSRRPLVTMADVGGSEGLRRNPYGSEYLPEFGIEYKTAIYIRDGTRILGAVDLSRTPEEGDFTDDEIDFLRRTHVMLEGAYVTALRSAA